MSINNLQPGDFVFIDYFPLGQGEWGLRRGVVVERFPCGYITVLPTTTKEEPVRIEVGTIQRTSERILRCPWGTLTRAPSYITLRGAMSLGLWSRSPNPNPNVDSAGEGQGQRQRQGQDEYENWIYPIVEVVNRIPQQLRMSASDTQKLKEYFCEEWCPHNIPPALESSAMASVGPISSSGSNVQPPPPRPQGFMFPLHSKRPGLQGSYLPPPWDMCEH